MAVNYADSLRMSHFLVDLTNYSVRLRLAISTIHPNSLMLLMSTSVQFGFDSELENFVKLAPIFAALIASVQ